MLKKSNCSDSKGEKNKQGNNIDNVKMTINGGIFSKRCRICRFGAGKEMNSGKGDTPGFPLQSHPTIDVEGQGLFQRKIYKSVRTSSRLNQTSLYMTQLWRGNVDVKPLLYFSNPMHPDMEDIVAVTDYVIGYQMKGAETLAVERKNMLNLIMKATDDSGTKEGLYTIARRWLNRSSVTRCISRQEAQCLLVGLPLVKCSEHIESIPISYRLKSHSEKDDSSSKSWILKYKNRNEDLEFSFHEYLLKNLNLNKKKGSPDCIPHYSGVVQYCKLPLSEYYCENALLIYKNWSKSNPIIKVNDESFVSQFKTFLKSNDCPCHLLITYERAKRSKHFSERGILSYEPTSQLDSNAGEVLDGYDSDEARTMIEMLRTHKVDIALEDDKLPRGRDYDWSQIFYERDNLYWDTAETFIQNLSSIEDSTLTIPHLTINYVDVPYDLEMAIGKQTYIILRMMETIKNY